MQRNRITYETLQKKIQFYRNMSNSENTEDPFDFKNLEIAFHAINGICFRNCDFSNTVFVHATLSNVTFIDCNLENASFNHSDLTDVKIIRGSIADTRFTNSKIGYITIQFAKVSGTRFDDCNIYALRVESTTSWKNFLINCCKVRIATLTGLISISLTYTYIDILHVKNAIIDLENTDGLSIGTLSPYNATFLPKSQVKVLKRVSKVILPDDYEMNAITSRSTFHGYSKH